MKTLLVLVQIVAIAAMAQTAPPTASAGRVSAPMPVIKMNGAVKQMMVDGKPFIMLSGELHNSSASSIEYMKPIWKKLAALNLNTVIGTVSWELLEPQEGKFDFTLVDDQIRQARANNMRLVLIWFGTWKNAVASYIPLWVKTDLKRFPRVQSKEGVSQEELTPICEESLRADAKAFRTLMRHIRATDSQHTVIMMQVENEAGKLHDTRDRSPLAETAYRQAVPAELMKYLSENKEKLAPELTKAWGANGFRTPGTWSEVFGPDPAGDEIFMAWYIGRYVGKVAEAGKAELPIPMYANAWLGQGPPDGRYPSGGPNPQVHDIWRAAAPQLDLLAPDIYPVDFKGVCASFVRNGNPLFIPEARASVPNLIWSIGRHAALGYSPFGIENLPEESPLGAAYGKLTGMLPIIAKYQAEGKVAAVVQDQADQRGQEIAFGGYKLSFTFGGRGPQQGQTATAAAPQPQTPGGRTPPDNRSFALIVNTAPNELVFFGQAVSVTFTPDTSGPKVAGIGLIDEGRYEKGTWIPGRRLNGDENGGGVRLMIRGQGIEIQKIQLYRYE